MQEQAQNKYKGLSNEEKDTKREYGRNQYRDMSVEERQNYVIFKKIAL